MVYDSNFKEIYVLLLSIRYNYNSIYALNSFTSDKILGCTSCDKHCNHEFFKTSLNGILVILNDSSNM